MIKVYNGDAYAVLEDEYDRNRSLLFFLDGHTEEYIMIYRGGSPIKVLSYHDVLYNREIPEKVLYMAPDIFSQAREIFFSYEKSDRWNRAFAVCNTEGEAECILYYQENLTSFNYQVSEFENYGYKEDLDFDVFSRANTYVFEEYEEYTAFICEVLERKFPEKEKSFWMKMRGCFPAAIFIIALFQIWYSGTKTLGVVARGTDYRHGGFDLPSPMEDSAYIELVKQKMEEWGCSELLLATEDEDILERFKRAKFNGRLKYIAQERYRYPDISKPGIVVAKLKKPTNDYHNEMPYLAVLYLLAECSSLISNCRCGAF